MLGCDLIVTAGDEALAKIQAGVTRALVNRAGSPTADSSATRTGTSAARIWRRRSRSGGDGECAFVDATALATALMGDSIATNLFMLGYAWQKGGSACLRALQRAIELNGVAVEANKGRSTGAAPRRTTSRRSAHRIPGQRVELKRVAKTLDEIVAKRVDS